MDCVILLRVFVFSLFCCKLCDIYLNTLNVNGFWKFSNISIYNNTEGIK